MESDKPRTGPKADAERAARQAREAAALRENLHRRKEQARAREAAAEKDQTPCR